ncbi:DNA/RNA non-specific endonuclease [Sphingobium sp. 3R8]|uniref:DNA/RNA non-specific endonuclease n=1 Tax=Sphingobium sp. 3R8 TaxID=2874921 RepID=UPI001CCC73FD|nr:DNA/RNA non-specific endonuclease [Sphingobium sp. 3R8]MBZ9646367.1 DNA/RNA non-specific endonuclease [Sphingobium sp. 3R8]
MTGRKGYLFFICSYWPATATASSFRESFDAADFAGRTDVFQAQAGKPDRLGDDDGGHFIAARFNGPSDSFNYFAQNANFNRGSYRAMEDGWARELRAGHKVFVDIEPLYEGTSKRPYQINVSWEVDGQRTIQKFPNQAKGRASGKR